MLHEFVTTHRNELILRCRDRTAMRLGLASAPAAAEQGVPLFLVQLVDNLRKVDPRLEGTPVATAPLAPRVLGAAAEHGRQMLHLGYGIEHVVRDYGDVCQAVTEMADELGVTIEADEFKTLNLALDDSIADAVKAFGSAQERAQDVQASDATVQLQSLIAEQGRLVAIAQHSCLAIRTGRVGINGATGALLAHALDEMNALAGRIFSVVHRTDASPGPAETSS